MFIKISFLSEFPKKMFQNSQKKKLFRIRTKKVFRIRKQKNSITKIKLFINFWIAFKKFQNKIFFLSEFPKKCFRIRKKKGFRFRKKKVFRFRRKKKFSDFVENFFFRIRKKKVFRIRLQMFSLFLFKLLKIQLQI